MTTMNEERAAIEAAYASVADGGWDSVKDMGIQMFKAGAAWQRAQAVAVPVELLEQIAVELEHDNDRYFLGRELRALLAAAPAQPAAQDQGEVQRLREALERATKLLSAAAGYATKMEPMPAKLLNAIDTALAACPGQEVEK